MAVIINPEEKLAYFTQALSKEITAKKRQSHRKLTAHVNEAIARARAQAEVDAKAQIAAAKTGLEKSRAKQLSQARTQARRALADLTGHLTSLLFQEIRADLIAFTQSQEYENFLIDSILSTMAKTGRHFAFVQLPQFHLAATIGEATGLTPEPAPETDIGGYRLLSANRSRALNHTFRHQLSKATEDFLTGLNAGI